MKGMVKGVEHLKKLQKEKNFPTKEEFCWEVARVFLPKIKKIFEDEKNQKDFEEWLKERNKSMPHDEK